MPERVQSLEEALEKVYMVLEKSYLSGEYDDEPAYYLMFREGTLLANSEREPRLLCPWRSNEEKRAYVTAARLMAEEHEVDMFVFVSEAWASKMSLKNAESMPKDDRGYPIPRVMPSQAPDRVEILSMYAGDKDGRRLFRSYEMLRDEAGTLTGFKSFMDSGADESTEVHSIHDFWDDRNLLESITEH
jgi:hypothetical protein